MGKEDVMLFSTLWLGFLGVVCTMVALVLGIAMGPPPWSESDTVLLVFCLLAFGVGQTFLAQSGRSEVLNYPRYDEVITVLGQIKDGDWIGTFVRRADGTHALIPLEHWIVDDGILPTGTQIVRTKLGFIRKGADAPSTPAPS